MGEGVDLHRSCRHVIHHDPAWNPSTIEQRTGRVDRLGCKAEGRSSIVVRIPFLSGAADERQYRVMSERERWFRVVMGQDEVARLITTDSEAVISLPDAVAEGLGFRLDRAAPRRGASVGTAPEVRVVPSGPAACGVDPGSPVGAVAGSGGG